LPYCSTLFEIYYYYIKLLIFICFPYIGGVDSITLEKGKGLMKKRSKKATKKTFKLVSRNFLVLKRTGLNA